MVVHSHFVDEALSPKSALARKDARPDGRQRALAHVSVATEEILALVLVVPMLGDRQRGRAFIRADLLLLKAPYCLVGLDRQIPADEARRVGEAVGKKAARRI